SSPLYTRMVLFRLPHPVGILSVPCHDRSFSRSLFVRNSATASVIYTLSLHDALPISGCAASWRKGVNEPRPGRAAVARKRERRRDRKSTRLNSSHGSISYAVFCLKKKTRRRADRGSRQSLSYSAPTPQADSPSTVR